MTFSTMPHDDNDPYKPVIQPALVCIGELLIDMMAVEQGFSLEEVDAFRALPGGAPANVCAAAARLNVPTSLVAKVGNDPFGRKLVRYIQSLAVNTDHIVLDNHTFTTMAYVSRDRNGERDFIFSRGADANLYLSDVHLPMLTQAQIVHFGSATGLLPGDFYDTYIACATFAHENGVTTSFDPNFRDALWEDPAACVAKCIPLLSMMNIVKVSEEEAQFVTDCKDLEQAAMQLVDCGPKLVCITMGSRGTMIATKQSRPRVIRSIPVEVVDTTGAGDAFVGGLLAECINAGGLDSLLADTTRLDRAVRRANVVGALVCTAEGAMATLPDEVAINAALGE